MKKRYIVLIIIVILILIALASVFIFQKTVEEGKKYEIEEIKDYGYFVVRENEKYGVIDKTGKNVVEAKYDNVIIPNPEKPVFVCYEGTSTKIFNANNEQILTEEQNVEPIRLKNIASSLMYEKTVMTYKENDKMGLINLEGDKLTKPIYEEISGLPYKEGELLVKEEGKYGVINIKGNELIKPEYDQINTDNYSDENGYKNSGYIVGIKTEEGLRYGYIDVKGKEILPTQYNEISRIVDIKDDNNIYLIAANNGQYGMFKNKAQIINNEYQSITYNSSDNTLTIEKTKKFGVANLDGQIIIPVQYTQIDNTGKYIYAENTDGVKNVYQKDGTEVDVDSNIAILETSNENYDIKIDNTNGTVYSIIDKNETQITKQNYTYLEYLYDNYFIASTGDGKLGVITPQEEQKIEIKYDSLEKLQNTDFITTTITQDKTTQLYDKNLNKLCELANANIEVKENYIKIYNETETKYFNLDGKETSNKEILTNNTIFATSKDGKWGFVDKVGNVVVDYIYDKVTDVDEYGYAGIKKDGKWGVIDNTGNIVLEPTYEFDSLAEPQFVGKYYKVVYGYGEFYYTV